MTVQVLSSDRWWKKKINVYEALCSDIKLLQSKQQYRSDQNLFYSRLYSNKNIESLQGDAYDVPDADPDRLVLNVVQSVVNAITAKISTNRPRCMPLTEGGNWALQQQAKQLGKFFDGQFYQSQIYRSSRAMFREACIMGTGALKFSTDWSESKNPQIVVERRSIDDIFVDAIDGRYGKPRMLHETQDMSREVALATWPDAGDALNQATQWRGAHTSNRDNSFADPVTIAEAWHLPSSSEAGDGRHVIACDAGDILDEPWKVVRFPLAFYKYLDEALGFFGGALVAQLVGIQVEMNKILRKVSQHMHLASSFICASRNTKLVKEHLVNTPWSLLEYTGDAPQFVTVAAISPEYFMQLDRLYARAFEVAGITELFATGRKPAGLDSGKAQREYKATESERFMDASQAWEELHFRDIPERLVDQAKIIDEIGEGSYSVLAVGEEENSLERIAWSDVNLEREKYVLQLHPTSFLPKQPAFRFQAVKEILEVVPEVQRYALKLLKYPDLDAVTKRLTAPIDYIELVTDRILYAESDADDLMSIFEPPDAFTDLPMALEISRGKLLRAKIDGAPLERLDLLMRYISSCVHLQQQIAEEEMATQARIQAQAMAEAQPQPAMPQGGPEAMLGPAGPEAMLGPGIAGGEPPILGPGGV